MNVASIKTGKRGRPRLRRYYGLLQRLDDRYFRFTVATDLGDLFCRFEPYQVCVVDFPKPGKYAPFLDRLQVGCFSQCGLSFKGSSRVVWVDGGASRCFAASLFGRVNNA